MRLLTILFLLTLAMLRLQAAAGPEPANAIHIDPQRDGEWGMVTRDAQTQFQQRKFPEAVESVKRAQQIAKHFPSGDRMATNYYQLGNIYRDWGHCAEARANYSRAIATWEKQPNPKPKYLFSTIVNLLDTMCECEEYDAVVKAFRKYDAKLQHYKSDPLDEAELLSLRGMIFRARKKYVQAESYYRQAIQLREQTPGSARVQIEEERGNLAMLIDKQGRHVEALAEAEHVIAFFDHSGVSRPATLAGALNNAACSLADLSRKEEAEQMFERALAVAVAAFGEDTRFAAIIMLNYARVLRENKQAPAADAMQRKGAETFRRAVLRDNATVDVADLRSPP